MVKGVPPPGVPADVLILQWHPLPGDSRLRLIPELADLGPAEGQVRVGLKGGQLLFKALRPGDVVGVHPGHQLEAARLEPGVQRLAQTHILGQGHRLPPGVLFIFVQNRIELRCQRPVLHHDDLGGGDGLVQDAVQALTEVLGLLLAVNRKQNGKIHAHAFLPKRDISFYYNKTPS